MTAVNSLRGKELFETKDDTISAAISIVFDAAMKGSRT
jgi:hypothetical protein